MNIGLAIKLARENLGFTRKNLAKKSELSQSTITRIENGERSLSLESAQNIAGALGLHLSQLVAIAEAIFEPENEMKKLQGRLLLAVQPILIQKNMWDHRLAHSS